MSGWTVIITCLALVLYLAHAVRVTLGRGKYNIVAPATTGHPIFERLLRIQANTGEQLLVFLPSLWLFSYYISAVWAAVLGLVWLLARIAYGLVYETHPDRRGAPFGVAFAATLALLIGSLIGGLLALLR
jgi:glutathione S-transferase